MLKRKSFHFVFAILAWLLFSAWGFTGHKKIGEGTSKYFDPKMSQFHEWTTFLKDHSSDADNRKSSDSEEGIKHYIDIDNYAEFVLTGAISQVKDSMIDRYGVAFVNEQGTLPWSTMATFDSLVNCFSRFDFDKAKVFAADLSHYVADGNMPLHITQNYDGQLTGNKGIHSQYETKMIGNFVDQLEIVGGEVSFVSNVSDYIFSYLYATYPYVDSILLADDYARSINSDVSSFAYSKALWEKTKNCTITLFENSSKSISELIYTAWVTAGSPSLDEKLSNQIVSNTYFSITSMFVNYNDSLLHIQSVHSKEMNIDFKIFNIDGKEVKMKCIGSSESGNHDHMIDVSGLSKGIYFLVMKGNKQRLTKKFTI